MQLIYYRNNYIITFLEAMRIQIAKNFLDQRNKALNNRRQKDTLGRLYSSFIDENNRFKIYSNIYRGFNFESGSFVNIVYENENVGEERRSNGDKRTANFTIYVYIVAEGDSDSLDRQSAAARDAIFIANNIELFLCNQMDLVQAFERNVLTSLSYSKSNDLHVNSDLKSSVVMGIASLSINLEYLYLKVPEEGILCKYINNCINGVEFMLKGKEYYTSLWSHDFDSPTPQASEGVIPLDLEKLDPLKELSVDVVYWRKSDLETAYNMIFRFNVHSLLESFNEKLSESVAFSDLGVQIINGTFRYNKETKELTYKISQTDDIVFSGFEILLKNF